MSTLPAAVLWDLDGTLIDTEPYWMECEHELVRSFGGVWTDDDAMSIVGFDLLNAAAVIKRRAVAPDQVNGGDAVAAVQPHTTGSAICLSGFR